MTRGLAVAAAGALLAGCAAAPVPPEAPAAHRPLASYAGDPFPPVNLYLNANEQTTPAQAALIEYAVQRLQASGAFVRLDRGVQRWPITLQARYRYETRGGFTRLLGALTLGLVPVRVTQEHALFAEVFAEPESVAALDLTLSVTDRVSLYDDALATERAAVEALLERLLGEIAQRELIPRWRTFEAPAAPPKKKKIPGRAA